MKITGIVQQIKRSDKVNIYIDSEYALAISKNNLIDFGLYVGKILDDKELTELKKKASESKVFYKALDFISRRSHGEKELELKLQKKGFDDLEIKPVIEKLKRLDLLNDLSFSISYLNDKKSIGLKSRRQIEAELQRKGISGTIIKKLSENYSDEEELLTIKKLLNKKYSNNFDRDKALRFLAQRGFGFDLIKKVIDEFIEK